MTRTALKTTRSLLGVVLVALLVPAALSAQASGTMKVSATVVASQTMAPQTSAAELADMVVEQLQSGEQVTPQALDLMDVEEPGVSVSMDVAEHSDLTAPVVERSANEQRILHMTVAYSGN